MEFVNSIAQIVHQEVRNGPGTGILCPALPAFCELSQQPAHWVAATTAGTCSSPSMPSLPACPCQVALHGGAANKNIGDAFLLVWKLSGGRRMMDASRRSTLSRASATSRGSSGAVAAGRASSMAAGAGRWLQACPAAV